MSRHKYDVIVAGGGLAGVCAATAAARAGARTLLVEKQPCAGGIATACLEPSICNYFKTIDGRAVLGGCPRELVERMVDRGGAAPGWHMHRGHIIFDIEIGKLAMDEMLEDAGADILYDTLVAGVDVADRSVTSLTVANRSGIQSLSAACIVDATGDNDVVNYAGVEQNDRIQPHSFLFRLGNVDMDALVNYTRERPEEFLGDRDIDLSHEEAHRIYDETGRFQWHHFAAKKMRLIQAHVESGEYPEKWHEFYHMDAFQIHGIRETGTLVVNTGFFNTPEPTGETMSHWIREGRKLAHYVAAFMRKHVPGCEDSFVLATANSPGLRRTRSLKNRFVLTRELYDEAPTFPDAVGRGVLIGKGRLVITDKTFDIPLRCLVPAGIDNLIVGSGRGAACAPAELLRVMPITMATGQGAGVAAAVAAASGTPLADADIATVQAELGRQGVELGA